jgi:hypothetical protein
MPVRQGRSVRRWIAVGPADVIDLFVYVVVLNLAIENVPSAIEGFTLSPLTAALTLELLLLLKGRIITRLRAAAQRRRTTRDVPRPGRHPCGCRPGRGET